MRLIDADKLQAEYKERHDGKRLLLLDVQPTVLVPQWIPCSEGLPPEDQDVFVYLFYNKCPYIAWVNDGHWRTEEFDVDKEYEPIAWMPLPEPARLENV